MSDNPSPPQVGVDGATLTPDANTGNRKLVWVEHYWDGSSAQQGTVTLKPWQVAEALREIPMAFQVLSTQMQASGGVATEEMLAGIMAFCLWVPHIPQPPSGTIPTTPAEAPPLLFNPPSA